MPKVLLIEDDAILLKLYKMAFEKAGQDMNLLSTNKGREGLAMIKREKPDLVLLDIKIDDLDGLEILKQIKADPETEKIKIIMLTNVSEEAVIAEAQNSGADEVVFKTEITPPQLVELARERLKK
ncbi:MAG: response regulator [bacterium]